MLALGDGDGASTITLNTLSRLKGIETLWGELPLPPQLSPSEYTFPFEGN